MGMKTLLNKYSNSKRRIKLLTENIIFEYDSRRKSDRFR